MSTVGERSERRIIVALDCDHKAAAIQLLKRLDPNRCRVKIGSELFTSLGPEAVSLALDYGYDVFLDLKFHDIPATVAKACRAAARLGVWMLNVHASGGTSMLEAARNAIDTVEGCHKPLLIAVTALTNLSSEVLQQLYQADAQTWVSKLAHLAHAAGLDGVVCSPLELDFLRQTYPEFCLVTPGIRTAAVTDDDQCRTMTPANALQCGADYLVIGRPITQAQDPLEALCQLSG